MNDPWATATGSARGKVMIELKYYGHDEKLEQRVVDLAFFFGAAAPDPPASVDAPV